jgi:hypothetical protein
MIPQEIYDYHCKQIREAINNEDTFAISCLNWMKNNASAEEHRMFWKWVGSQLVMSGWLTVNDENNFEIKRRD